MNALNPEEAAVKTDVWTQVQVERERVADGQRLSIVQGCEGQPYILVLVWPQLGDFDSLEYAWWLMREQPQLAAKGVIVRAVGIGNRRSGERFCSFTGFPAEWLFVDETATLHRQIGLYQGLSVNVPGLSSSQRAWLNLMLMCAGIGSPGTLKEVFRGYRGDRQAPQLIADGEVVRGTPLPPLSGDFFRWAGGKGFQRPFELATLRLRNMTEVLSHWGAYVPDASYLTQRGGTFLLDGQGQLLYEYRDRGVLGFAENMSYPLAFLENHL